MAAACPRPSSNQSSAVCVVGNGPLYALYPEASTHSSVYTYSNEAPAEVQIIFLDNVKGPEETTISKSIYIKFAYNLQPSYSRSC